MNSFGSSSLIDSRRTLGLLGISVFFVVFMLGCDSVVPGEDISFEEVEGFNGHLRLSSRLSGTRVFRTSAEWDAFTEEHNIWPVPAVDFASHILLGVFWGDTFYSGCHGHARAIQSVHEFGDKLFVEVGPMSDLGICRAIVFPRQFVTVARVDLDVLFIGDVPGSEWLFVESE